MTSQSEASEPAATAADAAGTVDAAEIERFSAIADAWWDPTGKFKPLHALNPVRLRYIRDRACAHFSRSAEALRPLAGLTVLDIGCGGGLLCEPLTRLGANVVGIDAAERNIAVASLHARQSDLAIDYRCTTAEALVAAGETFDIVLSLEVVEHVADPDLFLRSCGSLVGPGGMAVAATLNRTPRSFALAIVGAEYVLGWLPRGTHNWRKFLRPSELARGLRAGGLTVREIKGVGYDPLRARWSLSPDIAVNYMVFATRTD